MYMGLAGAREKRPVAVDDSDHERKGWTTAVATRRVSEHFDEAEEMSDNQRLARRKGRLRSLNPNNGSREV